MLTVSQVISQALVDLQEDDETRWTRQELLGYFNAGQRALAMVRPDLVAQERVVALRAGWSQELDADVLHLLAVTNNAGGRQHPITKIEQWALDAVSADWRSLRGTDELLHYMHSLKHPRELAVYPPARAGAEVRMVVAVDPPPLTSENDPPSVPAQYLDALLHYVLYRAWSKDAEYAANAQLATGHLELFNQALGAQAQSAAAVEPTT